MESYEILQVYSQTVQKSCSDSETTILYDGTSLVYHSLTHKDLPWFKIKEMSPVSLSLHTDSLIILTQDGTVLILPISSLSDDSLALEWRKFISKTFFTLMSNMRQDSLLDMLGGCMINRDRPFENHLDISIFKVKGKDFVTINPCSNFLLVGLKNALWVIEPSSGALVNKINFNFDLVKTEVIDDKILLFSLDAVFYTDSQNILKEKAEIFKSVWKGNVCIMKSEKIVAVVSGQRMKVFGIQILDKVIASFWVPEGFDFYFLWKNFIVCIDPGITVVAKVPYAKSKMLEVVEVNEKNCICGKCMEKEKGVDYTEWVHLTQDTCVIWKNWHEIGKVRKN